LLPDKDGHSVLGAIAADPDLTATQKQSLTQIYETFRRENSRAGVATDHDVTTTDVTTTDKGATAETAPEIARTSPPRRPGRGRANHKEEQPS
jgi:hypothetical protein